MAKRNYLHFWLPLVFLVLFLVAPALAEWKQSYTAQGNNVGLVVGSNKNGGPLGGYSDHKFPASSNNSYTAAYWNWGVHVARDCDGDGTAEDTACVLGRGAYVLGGNNSLESIDLITALAAAGENMYYAVTRTENNRLYVSTDAGDLADWPPEFREGRSSSGEPVLHGVETIASRYGDCFYTGSPPIGQSVEYQFYFLDTGKSNDMVYMHVFFRNMSEYLKWNAQQDIRDKVADTPDGQVWQGMEQFYCTANSFRIGIRDEAWAYYFPRQLIVMADRDGQEGSFSGHPAAMAYYQMRNPHLRDEVLEFTNTGVHGWSIEFGFYPVDVMEGGYPMNDCYRYGLGRNAPAGPFYPDDINPYTGGPMYGWPGVLTEEDARYEQWIWGERNAYNNYNFWSEFHDVAPRDSFSLDAAIMFVQLANEPYMFPSSYNVANIDDPGVQAALAPVIDYADAADVMFERDFNMPEIPISPPMTIIPGDGEVVISWSDVNVNTPDNYYYYLQDHPEHDPDGAYREYDFQGYWLRRSETWDFQTGTSLAEFNVETGLEYSYVDDNVTNGKIYYYSVVAYDLNYLFDGDSTVQISYASPITIGKENRAVPKAGIPASCELPGDVNSDGAVDIIDITAIVQFALGNNLPSTQELLCADMNDDGVINIFDVIACLHKALGRDLMLAGVADENLSNVDMQELKGKLSALGAGRELIEQVSELCLREQGRARLPKSFSLGQNYPNPFNPSTSISYSIPEGAAVSVSLRVYDIRGRLVRTLVNAPREPADYIAFWDGMNDSGQTVPSAIYIYRLQAGSFMQSRKMVLLK
jgi:dockerin type I repeat protein